MHHLAVQLAQLAEPLLNHFPFRLLVDLTHLALETGVGCLEACFAAGASGDTHRSDVLLGVDPVDAVGQQPEGGEWEIEGFAVSKPVEVNDPAEEISKVDAEDVSVFQIAQTFPDSSSASTESSSNCVVMNFWIALTWS